MGKPHADNKTNAMRIMDAAGVEYGLLTLDIVEAISGVEVAERLNQDPDRMFKTLVTRGASGEYRVCMVPVAEHLDLKKAARAHGEKALSMLPQKELFGLTGYVHGGCSPIGMKKQFATVIDETAQLYDTILFSGGRIGCQVEVSPDDLAGLIPLAFADIVV